MTKEAQEAERRLLREHPPDITPDVVFDQEHRIQELKKEREWRERTEAAERRCRIWQGKARAAEKLFLAAERDAAEQRALAERRRAALKWLEVDLRAIHRAAATALDTARLQPRDSALPVEARKEGDDA